MSAAPVTAHAEQTEKAYLKQPIFQNTKISGKAKSSTKLKRWTREVGLGFKTPSEAINGTYIDKNLHYIPKYNRYEKRHKNVAAHCSPAFRVEEGDIVTVGQCRPLTKTVRFNVLRVQKGKQSGSKQLCALAFAPLYTTKLN
ncbi:40S ribosomal protein S11-B [Cystobasidiomycetes sp. EMM_F5]